MFVDPKNEDYNVELESSVLKVGFKTLKWINEDRLNNIKIYKFW